MENTTKLSTLATIKNNYVSFLDENKIEHKCIKSTIDFNKINEKNYHCWWCKYPINEYPIGCPINYKPNKLIKNYNSIITKSKYTLT